MDLSLDLSAVVEEESFNEPAESNTHQCSECPYISSCSPFSSIMRGSSLHEEYESHWVDSTFVMFLNGLSFGIKLGRET